MYFPLFLVAREEKLSLRKHGLMFLFTPTSTFLPQPTNTSAYGVPDTTCLVTNISIKIII